MDLKSRKPSGLDRTEIARSEAAYRLWCNGVIGQAERMWATGTVKIPAPKRIEAADSASVLQEQLEMLVEECSDHGACLCPFCERLRRVSVILMEIFETQCYNETP